MLQQLINILYRFPKGKIITYKRFGGYFAYRKSLKAHEEMKLASYQLPPIASKLNGLPIYFLTGKKYIHQTLFCIQSLAKVSKADFLFYLVDDGSFDQQLLERIQLQLPGAILISKNTIEQYINSKLPAAQFPNLHRKRAEYPHIKKLTDIHLYPDGKDFKLVLDSDMLFWRAPKEIIEWLKNPQQCLHMVDCGEAYGYPHQKLEELANQNVPKLVNAGAIGLNSQTINWKKIEEWIGSLENDYGKSYYLEQALSAMLIGEQPAIVLSAQTYIVNPTEQDIEINKGILHHYVDLSKKGYYQKAWKELTHA